MVSLRERKSRASYSNIAEGLANLSSDEEGPNDDEGNVEAGPSRAGTPSGSKAVSQGGNTEAKGDAKDDDDSEMSSGESSEFRPDSPAKKGGKGKGRAQETDDDDDEDDDELMNEVVDSDEDDAGQLEDDIDPALRSISETPDLMAGASRGSKAKRPKATTSSAGGGGTARKPPPLYPHNINAAYAAHGSSEINLIDLKYRALIKASTVALTKAPTGPKVSDAERHALKDREQSRIHGVEVFPNGHPVPFSTRLTVDPQHGWTSSSARPVSQSQLMAWVDESGPSDRRKADRRAYAWKRDPQRTLGAPWQDWKGEGWWPEMYVGPEEGMSGARENWLMRDEVTLGLDQVGRWTREQMHFLDEHEAEMYLPTPTNKNGDPWISCYTGPHHDQVPLKYSLFDSKSLSETSPNVPREGHTFFAGGPIWGLDWCPLPETESAAFGSAQYLAVTTLPHIDTCPAMFEKWPRTSKGSIQIWSHSSTPGPSVHQGADQPMDGTPQKGGMKCELVLCVQGGPLMEIKWMPMGVWDKADSASIEDAGVPIPKLGIIAGIQLDGSVSFYAVPHPHFLGSNSSGDQPLYLRLDEPLIRLEMEDSLCMSFDWVTASRVAVGLSNGHVAVWDVYDALRSCKQDDLLPSLYTSVASSAIRSIAVGRVPPAEDQLGGDPIYLVMGSYDGSTVVMDFRDPLFPVEVNKARVPNMAVGWLAQLASPVICDIDFVVQTIKMRKTNQGKSHYLTSHRGQAWSIASSDYHTMVISAGADGVLMMADYSTGFHRKRKEPLKMQRLYEVDYNRTTDEYRIFDDILPESQTIETATARRPPVISKRATHDPSSHILKTGAWSPHVGLHKVRWNDACGIAKAGWVVSGGASGLGRVEWVEGRYRNGVAPR
ncbi:hypothetical protein I316_06126 [Kwoniella heveanensis BCC8398]|uniref:Transcription factor tau subunit sfc6 n=1 Tax=Kwoniella heveanensis BCC8398 TaxID=1296120 RepID=A0A1B9GMG9_9TREE|nr:hypothetical protein I316_06126 [Kwoniella heveanensis BCC8398]